MSLKRHLSLVPLSHDHHHGLVAARRLVSGRSAYPDVASPSDSVSLLWERELREHFRQEEEYLFGLNLPATLAPLIERALREHKAMRDLALKAATEEVDCEAFGQLLEGHIRFEERELFPALQESLSEVVLASVGREILGARKDDGDGL